MNWITKVLKIGEKIKTAIKKRPNKEEIVDKGLIQYLEKIIMKF